MKRRVAVLVFLVVSVLFRASGPAMAADLVSFEPVKAPYKGSDNAPVTIIEIADFM